MVSLVFSKLRAQQYEEYDKTTFSVLPFQVTVSNPTLADTAIVSWKQLSDSSLLNSKVAIKFLKGDYIVSDKYFYNPVQSTPEEIFAFDMSDTTLLNSFIGNREVVKENEALGVEKIGLSERYITKIDPFGGYIKSQLENSRIPGEMMYQWTVPQVLRLRAMSNLTPTRAKETINTDNMNFFKKLLEKNYIVVTYTYNRTKYKYTSAPKKEVLGTGKLQEKIRSKLLNETHTDKIAEVVKEVKIDSSKYQFSSDSYMKAYIFRVVPDNKVMSYLLGEYPAVVPPTANLEFIGTIVSENPKQPLKSMGATQALGSGKISLDDEYEKNLKYNYLERNTLLSENYLNAGELICARNQLTYLKELFPLDTKVDSLLKFSLSGLTESPQINAFRLENEDALGIDKRNMTKEQEQEFYYNQACVVQRFSSLKGTELRDSQGTFNGVLEVMERQNDNLRSLAFVKGVKGNKITSNLTTADGIYMDEQYKVVRKMQNTKTGELYDKTMATAKVIHVSKGGDDLTKLALVGGGGRVKPDMILVENSNKGFALNAGYGQMFDERAIEIGADVLIGRLLRMKMNKPGFKIGVNYVVNTVEKFSTTNNDKYMPSFFMLNLSREYYLSRIIDFKPFIAATYGGQWGADKENSETNDQSLFPTVGVQLPINTIGRNSKIKFRLMPEVSYSLGFSLPQFNLQTNFNF